MPTISCWTPARVLWYFSCDDGSTKRRIVWSRSAYPFPNSEGVHLGAQLYKDAVSLSPRRTSHAGDSPHSIPSTRRRSLVRSLSRVARDVTPAKSKQPTLVGLSRAVAGECGCGCGCEIDSPRVTAPDAPQQDPGERDQHTLRRLARNRSGRKRRGHGSFREQPRAVPAGRPAPDPWYSASR